MNTLSDEFIQIVSTRFPDDTGTDLATVALDCIAVYYAGGERVMECRYARPGGHPAAVCSIHCIL